MEQETEVQCSIQQTVLVSEMNRTSKRALEDQRTNLVTEAVAEISRQLKQNGAQLHICEVESDSYAPEMQQMRKSGMDRSGKFSQRVQSCEFGRRTLLLLCI